MERNASSPTGVMLSDLVFSVTKDTFALTPHLSFESGYEGSLWHWLRRISQIFATTEEIKTIGVCSYAAIFVLDQRAAEAEKVKLEAE